MIALPYGRWLGAGALLVVLAVLVPVAVLRRTDTGMPARIVPVGSAPQALAVDAQTGRAFVTNFSDDSVSMLDAGSGALLGTIAVGRSPSAVVVSTHARRAFVLTDRGDGVSMLDTASGNVLRTVSVKQTINEGTQVAVDEQRGRVFVAGSGCIDPGAMAVLDARSGVVLRTTALGTAPGGMAVDPRMHRLWFTADHTVNVLDEATGRIVRVIPVGLAPTRVAIDERLGRVFVTNQNDNTVRMVDERAGVVLRTIAVGMTPSTVAVDAATGPVFVVNAADGTLSVLDARRGIVLRTVRLGGQRPQPLTDTNATDLMVDEHAARAFVIDGSPFVIDGRTVDSRGNPAPALLVGSGLSPHQPRAPPPRRRRQYRPPLRRPDPAHRRGTRLVRQC